MGDHDEAISFTSDAAENEVTNPPMVSADDLVSRHEDAARLRCWYESTITKVQVGCLWAGMLLMALLQRSTVYGDDRLSAMTGLTLVFSVLHHTILRRRGLLPIPMHVFSVAYLLCLSCHAEWRGADALLALCVEVAETRPLQSASMSLLLGMGIFLAPGNYRSLATKLGLRATPLEPSPASCSRVREVGLVGLIAFLHNCQMCRASSDPLRMWQVGSSHVFLPLMLGGMMAVGLEGVADACWGSLLRVLHTNEELAGQLGCIEKVRKQELREQIKARSYATQSLQAEVAMRRRSRRGRQQAGFAPSFRSLPEDTMPPLAASELSRHMLIHHDLRNPSCRLDRSRTAADSWGAGSSGS